MSSRNKNKLFFSHIDQITRDNRKSGAGTKLFILGDLDGKKKKKITEDQSESSHGEKKCSVLKETVKKIF